MASGIKLEKEPEKVAENPDKTGVFVNIAHHRIRI